MYSDDSDNEEEEQGTLPSLSDPDFAQFTTYLGVDVTQMKQGNSTSGSSGVLSSGGSSGSTALVTALPPDINEMLLRIVQEAYVAPLPPNWAEFADTEGRIYFYNYVTEQSSWAHPTDRTYKELIQMVKKMNAASLSREETMGIIDAHLQSIHQRALEAIQGFSGPYMSDEGHEYYYNERTGVSTWESPVVEWEYNISTRYHVLYRCLIEPNESRPMDKNLKLQLPLHLVNNPESAAENHPDSADSDDRKKKKFEPPTPSTSRSFHTARSQGSARTARSQRAGDRSKSPSNAQGKNPRKDANKNPPSPQSHQPPAPPAINDDADSDDQEPFNFTFGTGKA